ncbi:hypothetical protein COX85_01255 [Candidatus Micrarchaeota archaeon CG_4_10_14_0_2_um_filter_55_9]|nr:MAG: hypothetical protein COX85_01255 [Candidatus Micrarchaeota archaeon CG_4_10_14_0_2_um_filter_55_9]
MSVPQNKSGQSTTTGPSGPALGPKQVTLNSCVAIVGNSTLEGASSQKAITEATARLSDALTASNPLKGENAFATVEMKPVADAWNCLKTGFETMLASRGVVVETTALGACSAIGTAPAETASRDSTFTAIIAEEPSVLAANGLTVGRTKTLKEAGVGAGVGFTTAIAGPATNRVASIKTSSAFLI